VVKQVFNDEGVVYNNLKVLRKTEPRIAPNGDKRTRVDAECLVCGTVKNFDLSKIKGGRAKSCGCVALGRRKDISGKKQGKLTAVETTHTTRKGSVLWKCICDCGGFKELTVSEFTMGHTQSCGCMQYQGTPKDLTGEVFGRLTVVRYTDEKTSSGNYRWLCLCSCGDETIVSSSALVQGTTKSCGCYNIEVVKEKSTTHGMSNTPEYGAWKNAVRRCCNEKDANWENYGGRGINMCDSWSPPAEIGFTNFYNDMGPCNGLTLERVDVNLGYSKENCVWEDTYTQGYNQRIQSGKQANTSGKTGVSENKDGTWQSYINFEGKRYPLGNYATFDAAKAARESAEIKFYGKLKGH